jgi:Bpu10I restriction endonuclease
MFVHGNNLEEKEKKKKAADESEEEYAEHCKYLAEIRVRYNQWKSENEALIGPVSESSENDIKILTERVRLLNEYKNFLDQQHYAERFEARSNLHSSVLEEFLYYLFRDLVKGISANSLIGKSHSFKDVFFRAPSYKEMIEKSHVLVEKKDHDFIIGAKVKVSMQSNGSDIPETYDWDIPAVAIECKTYLDKTMLQDASTAAEQLKQKNPNAMYLVVAEWLKLSESVNFKKYKIDQIYVLRKQKNKDRKDRYNPSYQKNPIYTDVIEHCFNTVREFLTADWEGGISHGLERGFLI